MKIVVTGAAGFIGGNFVYYLLERHPQDEILCVDTLTYAGNLSTLAGALQQENCRFFRVDITDRASIERLFQEEMPDAVVNFAAETHVDRCIDDPGLFLRTNVLGTQTLMDACRKAGVKRYHQVSTDEVYGDLPLDRPDLSFSEETPLRTSSPYSASKAGADLLVQSYCRTFGFPATISRCSNNYGPYQFPEKLIPLVITRALQDLSIPVYGQGSNVRDWLHVQDHCSAIDLILRQGRIGEIYNIGGNSERANLQVVQTILRGVGKPDSLIRFVSDRPGHDLRYAINPSKIARELGWKATFTFEEGMAQTIQWYLSHRNWWEDILSGEYESYYEKMYSGR